jgi:hypothetical protein
MFLDIIVTLISSMIVGTLTLTAGKFVSKRHDKTLSKEKMDVENISNDFTESQNEINRSIDEKIKSIERELKNRTNIAAHEFSHLIFTFDAIQKEIEKKKNNEITEASILIRNYHEQALHQSKIQFWFSVIAASIGFIFILANVIIYFFNNEKIYLLNIIPGIVMDAIAFMFFKQSNEVRHRAVEYFDRLRTDNQKQKSLDLVGKITNTKLKDLIYAQIAINMSGVNTTADDFSKIVSLLNTDNIQEKL